MSRTAGQAIVETLKGRGVRRFYTVPGESFLEVLDAVDADPQLRLISCRHESGAAFMAEADGKLTGRPAVAMGTRSVGAANLSIGVQTAHEDSTPMLVLCGQVETSALGRGAFQEVDLPAFFAPITRHAETLYRPERAAEVAARAHWAATSGRGGPAMIALPADVLAGPCPTGSPELVPGRVAAVRPDADAVAAIADLLRRARRPIAVLGAGARPARAEVIARVERFGLGAYTAFRRQDAFPNGHPNYLGHLALGTPAELLEPLAEADLVLALGTRLGDTTTQGYRLPGPATAVVHVDLEPAALRAPVRLAWSVQADVAGFAQALLDHETDHETGHEAGHGPDLEPGPTLDGGPDWSAGHAGYLRACTAPERQSAPGGPVHPADVIAALARHLPDDVVLANDAGNFSVFAHRYWRFERPDSQLGPVSGAMGYGVPAAIGAGLAAPGRPVVTLAGDGGFLMTGQELETAARYGVPLLAVVFQNGLYGTIAMHQARRFGRIPGSQIADVDLAGYARGLGATATTVTDPDHLDDAVAEASRFTGATGPRVLVVRTDPDVLTPTARLSTTVRS
jgi:acetolactate synthase-1/2/3 large subunit